jgi:hypothetical protein
MQGPLWGPASNHKEAKMSTVSYKISEHYKNRDGTPFTGVLGGGYVVKSGVCTIPESAVGKAGRMLEQNYGAKRIDPTKAPEKQGEVKK